MKNTLTVTPIGSFAVRNGEASIVLDSRYAAGLRGLEGFSHLKAVWWFSKFNDDTSRNTLEVTPPYKNCRGPLGVFTTHSPMRPNPIGITTAAILGIDHHDGVVHISFTDADDGTPILDLKPYTPSLDRVEGFDVPDWSRHWPRSLEESATFDWENEF